ncbi:SDR family NAD(P)-dependent oxidoreductase [Actinomadura macrotermitis]|uniref:Putative oxidoreductase SadH n=1 Tax=Actinomadura macrotermitis TaxID=2585200 RepID=A0A7K0C0Q7_9ACTN|nr:putative oxidoreductase SadH [Actinomadura macrotermitis]
MRELAGKIVAITGAASGIGAATAVELAERGCDLALSDINDEGLQQTARRAEKHGVKVSTHVVDTGDRDAVYAFADAVVAEHGAVHMIINNAGVALTADVEIMSDENLEWLFDINFWGVVHGTRAFLPHLKRAGGGHIVNVSSVFGFIGVPSQSAYCAAKFAVRGFTESLGQELDIAGGKIKVTSVHPGGIRTNIAKAARFEGTVASKGGSQRGAASLFSKVARTTPEKAAKIIVAGIVADKRKVRIGGDAVAIDLMQRVAPLGYQRGMVRLAKLGRLLSRG